MRFQQIRNQLLSCLLLWLCVGALPTTAQQDSGPASTVPFANATVTDFKNKAQVQLPGQHFSAPSLSQVLPPDSEINTGNGQIVLQLEDGSIVTVHPHTHLVLKQPTPSNWQRLQLLLGKIKAEIQKRVSGAPQFQVGTPSAVISVRGTRFYVEVDTHKTTEVDVEEGAVQLENAKGIGAPVIIQAGSSSRVGENSAPEPAQPTKQLQQSGKSDSGGKGGQNNGVGNNGNHGMGNNGSHGMGNTHPLPPPTSHGHK